MRCEAALVLLSTLQGSVPVSSKTEKYPTTDGSRFSRCAPSPPSIIHQIVDLSFQLERILVCYQFLTTVPNVGRPVSLVVLVVSLLGISKDGGCQQLGSVLCPAIVLGAIRTMRFNNTYDR
jgi:hypothetical protein